jgi:hypothetical protein
MEKSSPDRLRGVEIAEVCNKVHLRTLRLVLTTCFKQAVLRTLELYQKARQSADIAKKHARQAELSVTRASVEVNKLQRLCTPELDVKTLQAIKDLVRSAELDIPKTSKLSWTTDFALFGEVSLGKKKLVLYWRGAGLYNVLSPRS